MTQKTKLEIIGPYTPEHEGPFCTRQRTPVELKFRDGRGARPLGGYVGKSVELTDWCDNGQFDPTKMSDTSYDLMNAREVPVAREFWLNRYPHDDSYYVYKSEDDARGSLARTIGHTIHVREVLPGEYA